MSIKNMTVNSIFAGSVSVFRLLSQFFVLPLLARYLSPEDYGVIALAMPFILFSILFARSGIEAPLLRDKERDPLIWSSSFWFVCLSGLFFMALIIGAAPIAAWFFETPQLWPILSWMALGILFQAMSIVPMALLRHQKRFKALSFVQMASIALGMISAVVIAIKGGGAWAIVLQGLVMHGSLFLFVMLASRFKPKLLLKFQKIKSHLAFGYTVLGASFLEFLRDSSRSFVIAKVLGTVLLGFYSIAFLFLYLPFRIISIVLRDVVYTYLAPVRDDKELMRSMLLLIMRCFSILVFPAMGILAVAYEPAFNVILSEKWVLSGKLYMLAAPAAALTAVISARAVFMQIIGEVKMNVRCGVEVLLLQLAVLLIFVSQGIEWAMIGFAISMYIYIPRELMLMRQYFNCRIIDSIKSMLPSFLITVGGAFVYLELITIMDVDNMLSGFFIAIAIGVVTLLLAIAAQYRLIRNDLDRLSPSMLGA